MSGLTRVETIGSDVVSFQDKDGRTMFTISTVTEIRRVWMGQPGMPQVELKISDARRIAEDLRIAARRLDEMS